MRAFVTLLLGVEGGGKRAQYTFIKKSGAGMYVVVQTVVF